MFLICLDCVHVHVLMITKEDSETNEVAYLRSVQEKPDLSCHDSNELPLPRGTLGGQLDLIRHIVIK